MPRCKNNIKKSYTGNEPSPKGLGYCASSEPDGKKMKGKDGNIWIKKSGRWVKHTITTKSTGPSKTTNPAKPAKPAKTTEPNCQYIVRYTKAPTKRNKITIMYPDLYGQEIDGKFYKWLSYNKFDSKPSKPYTGYKKSKLDLKKIQKDICGNKKTDNDLQHNIHKGYKTYLIHDNGGRPFAVAIKGNSVRIFKYDKEIADTISPRDYMYNVLVKEYLAGKIFIPKGYESWNVQQGKLTNDPLFVGNSILVKLKDKYVYIGDYIYEFQTTDEIKYYYSPVGNSDVPYPVCIGTENIYFMLDRTYVPIHHFKGLTKSQLIDAYSFYYGHSGNQALSDYAKKIKQVKIIAKRL